jgi:phospholipase/carboxylesterase
MSVAPELLDAVGDLLQPLLETLERVVWVQRHLYPPQAQHLARELAPCREAVSGPLQALEAQDWPQDLHFMRDRLTGAARQTVELVGAFVDASQSSEGPIGLYRALRRFSAVQETLYPLAPVFDPVSRWFLEPARRDDDALAARLRAAALRDDEAKVGVLHASNERGDRGGFSLYVPEAWEDGIPKPLIVSLHGGHGHGRDFLWTWLREARSRGMLLLSPTSLDRTWSMMGPDVDAEPLREMVESVAARYAVDRGRVLLTGMSDGATYALYCGLREGMPFTHLAPACGVLHPALFATGDLQRARGRPIYLIHGALDWMFPVAAAQLTRQTLLAAGARLVYREIEDLSHTYPRDENPKILDWLVGAATA